MKHLIVGLFALSCAHLQATTLTGECTLYENNVQIDQPCTGYVPLEGGPTFDWQEYGEGDNLYFAQFGILFEGRPVFEFAPGFEFNPSTMHAILTLDPYQETFALGATFPGTGYAMYNSLVTDPVGGSPDVYLGFSFEFPVFSLGESSTVAIVSVNLSGGTLSAVQWVGAQYSESGRIVRLDGPPAGGGEVPEPTSILLSAAGLIAVTLYRRRRTGRQL